MPMGDPWPDVPPWPHFTPLRPPAPRNTMALIVPVSDYGLVTVIRMDSDGNTEIRVNQPPASAQE